MASQYSKSFLKWMDSIKLGLLDELEKLPELDKVLADEVYRHLMEMACQAQSWSAITTGQKCLKRIPKTWLLPKLAKTLEDYIALNDDYEFHRLADLYRHLEEPIPDKLRKVLDAS